MAHETKGEWRVEAFSVKAGHPVRLEYVLDGQAYIWMIPAQYGSDASDWYIGRTGDPLPRALPFQEARMLAEALVMDGIMTGGMLPYDPGVLAYTYTPEELDHPDAPLGAYHPHRGTGLGTPNHR